MAIIPSGRYVLVMIRELYPCGYAVLMSPWKLFMSIISGGMIKGPLLHFDHIVRLKEPLVMGPVVGYFPSSQNSSVSVGTNSTSLAVDSYWIVG